MTNTLKKYFKFLTFLSFLVSSLINATPEINMPVPDFKGQDSNGNTYTVSNYSGKIVILEWTSPECPIAVKQYDNGNIQSLQKEAVDSGMVWLSISSSTDTDTLIKKTKSYSTARIIDTNNVMAKLYNVKIIPQVFIIDKDGKLVYKGAIDNNYVKAALGQLVTGRQVEKQTTEPQGCSLTY